MVSLPPHISIAGCSTANWGGTMVESLPELATFLCNRSRGTVPFGR
jgi:hypothetical protein